MSSPSTDAAVAAFITRWQNAQSAERANYALFLSELCDLLEVPRPDPASDDTAHNAYVFERAVPLHQPDGKTTTGRIDLYKRDCFVLEAKQYAHRRPEQPELILATDPASLRSKSRGGVIRGTEAWDDAMLAARGQADRYARNLPAGEPTPPFLLVVDVGHVIELYADFSQQGKAYLPFPDARSHRIRLTDLASADLRQRLRTVWLDPRALDPAKVSAAVTREVARHLAELAKSFEQHHDPKEVAAFLSRCLFCMFAEDVGLLPPESFSKLLDEVKGDPGSCVPLLQLLFEDMNAGRFSGLLKKKLLYFNGGLFANARALPVNGTQLGLLRAAARCEWRHVEPAIFGTLLERALSPSERHKLGAHYTPRSYVERLVLPTVVEPLRDDWRAVQAAAITEAKRGDVKAAIATVRAFHHQLCHVKVLDPACGSGNFLYVALEHLKRLEGEIFDTLLQLGDTLPLELASETVDPHQFLGLEINPRAAAIAELVLWIGYLQWHFRTRGDALPHEPVLRNFQNIENRDAVLAYDAEEFAQDETGKTKFVWDRRTYKIDPATGREIPDENAVIPLKVYKNPRPATWPQADFIVGNPPYIGVRRLKDSVGDGYVETIRRVFPAVPETCDYVMYWWDLAARAVREQRSRRFGFITTNSIAQAYSRRLLESHTTGAEGLKLVLAIADHPWVDAEDGADVRIAMTVGAPRDSKVVPKVGTVAPGTDEVSFREVSTISPDLKPSDTTSVGTKELRANGRMCFQGVVPAGEGFKLSDEDIESLGYGRGSKLPPTIRPYFIGRDLVQIAPRRYILDLFGLTEADVRTHHPSVYDWLLLRVKPERDQNKRDSYRAKWWIFAEPRPALRNALSGLRRFIATPYTAKFRPFVFVESDAIPDAMAYAIASDDAYLLGVLNSRFHVAFALAAGGRMGVGNDPRYTSNQTFLPFPFPDCTEKQKEKIRTLAEELDAHRKRAQAQHRLGLTDIYNVLEKVRAGTALTAKDKAIHDAAHVATLRQLHDELDAAVADAYGWPWPLSDSEILERVVALNAARAAEEAKGIVRWLRPDYQKPLLEAPAQSALGLTDATHSKSGAPKRRSSRSPQSALPNPQSRGAKAPWPKPLAERVKAVEQTLACEEKPATADDLAKRFSRAKPADIAEILETLVTLGRARPGDTPGTYVR